MYFNPYCAWQEKISTFPRRHMLDMNNRDILFSVVPVHKSVKISSGTQ